MAKRTTSSPAPQVGQFYRTRSAFLKHWPEARRALDLGAEYKLVSLFVEHCPTVCPWTWVQTGTQAEWASQWNVSERTFKRHLRILLDKGIVIGEVGQATSGVRSPRLKATFEFPIYRVHPDVIQFAARWSTATCEAAQSVLDKCQLGMGKLALTEYQDTTFKCQIGTYPSTGTYPEVPVSKLQRGRLQLRPSPATAGETPSSTDSIGDKYLPSQQSTIDIDIDMSGVRKEGSDRVRRRLRRRRADRGGSVTRRWTPDDDDPAPIGADPDRPARSGGADRTGITTPVLDAFDRAWQAARHDDPRLPPRLCSTQRSRTACRSWLKQTFIAQHCGGDVELAIAVVELFCEQVAAKAPGWAYRPNPDRGVWDPWQHLSPRAEATRQLLLDRGWKSAAEREQAALQEADRKVEAAAVQERRQVQLTAREEWERTRAGAPILIPFRLDGTPAWSHYEWLLDEQTVDHLDWVEVPWDDGLPGFGRASFEEWSRRQSLR